jgi:hypothetical protein
MFQRTALFTSPQNEGRRCEDVTPVTGDDLHVAAADTAIGDGYLGFSLFPLLRGLLNTTSLYLCEG